jgi:1,4-dihydroxy-2-naphthoate octaprenyltransferase
MMGLGLGLLYSLPGAQLSARGIGEAAVAIAFGVLPVLGALWLQTGIIDSGAVLICIPVGAWAAAILIINEVPDLEADRGAHKFTLVVRWGVHGARWIYWALTVLALAASCAAILRHALPLWYAPAALVLASLGLKAALGMATEPAARPRLKQSIELTLAIHALGCIALLAAVLVKRHM